MILNVLQLPDTDIGLLGPSVLSGLNSQSRYKLITLSGADHAIEETECQTCASKDGNSNSDSYPIPESLSMFCRVCGVAPPSLLKSLYSDEETATAKEF